MRRAWVVAAIALGIVASSLANAAASNRPDFSGRWVLSMTKSQFGKIPGGQPKARTDLIVHREPRIVQTLHIQTATLDTTVYRYATDSTRVVNQVDGRDITAHVWWEGSILRLESRTKLLIFDMSLSERWSLSPDGKTLVNTRRVTYPGGKGDQTLVFERR